MLGFCFIYLMFIEGLYDENIRILYTLKQASEGIEINYENIKDKVINKFKNDLDSVFFEGYNNRLRNAIAHSRFYYNDATKEVDFNDVNLNTGEKWSDSISMKRFVDEHYSKIDSICRLRNNYMMLLGIRDLVLAKTPFDRTSFKQQVTKS